jgi:Atypical Arm repeat
VWNLVADGRLLEQVARTPGVVQAFVHLLRVLDMSVVRIALSFIAKLCSMLKDGALMVEKAGGIEAIDELHYGNVDASLSHEAAAIIDRYFGEDYQGDQETSMNSNSINMNSNTGFVAQGVSAAQQQQQQALPHLGRGRAVVMPAWMNRANATA